MTSLLTSDINFHLCAKHCHRIKQISFKLKSGYCLQTQTSQNIHTMVKNFDLSMNRSLGKLNGSPLFSTECLSEYTVWSHLPLASPSRSQRFAGKNSRFYRLEIIMFLLTAWLFSSQTGANTSKIIIHISYPIIVKTTSLVLILYTLKLNDSKPLKYQSYGFIFLSDKCQRQTSESSAIK